MNAGLGFLACGIAIRQSQSPVAIIVTSGTATANLYPAIIEAPNWCEFICLTADRARLWECGTKSGHFAAICLVSIQLPC